MVDSQVTSITPATHADRHRHGGADPLTGDVRIDDVEPNFTTVTNVTGSRSAGSTYQNTGDVPISVHIDCTHSTSDNTKTSLLQVSPNSDMSSSLTLFKVIRWTSGAPAEHDSPNGIIPVGQYYKLSLTNLSLTTWIEVI